jgi:hypothetical protein
MSDHVAEKKAKTGRGLHPNSKKNLKPIEKGEVRNPLGGRAHDPHLKVLRSFTNEYMKEILELAVMNNIEGLKAIITNQDSPAIQVGIARALVEAIRHGDWTTLEKIVERLIGKVPDRLQVQAQVQTENSIKIEFVKP